MFVCVQFGFVSSGCDPALMIGNSLLIIRHRFGKLVKDWAQVFANRLFSLRNWFSGKWDASVYKKRYSGFDQTENDREEEGKKLLSKKIWINWFWKINLEFNCGTILAVWLTISAVIRQNGIKSETGWRKNVGVNAELITNKLFAIVCTFNLGKLLVLIKFDKI